MLNSDELGRLSDELLVENRISIALHCAECGYNLRQLPYIYTCPECGGAYNARPLEMKGIFFPHTGRFPFGEIIALLLSTAAVGLLGFGAFEKVVPTVPGTPAVAPPPAIGTWQITDPSRLGMAALFAVMAMAYAWPIYRQLRRYVKRLVIAHRIALEED